MSVFLSRGTRGRVGGAMPFAAGPETGFTENLVAAFEETSTVNSHVGFRSRFNDLFRENVDRLNSYTGQEVAEPAYVRSLSPFGFAARSRPDDLEMNAITDEGLVSGQIPMEEIVLQHQRTFDSLTALMATVAQASPEAGILTLDQIIERVRSEGAETVRSAQDVASRATTLGDIGQFVGGMAGSFTLNDPLNIATLGVGGVGRTMFTRVLTEAGAGASIEAVNVFAMSDRNRKNFGLDPLTVSEKLAQVAFAGAGAGVLRGGLEGTVPAVKAVNNRLTRGRRFATELDEMVTETDLAPLAHTAGPDATAQAVSAAVSRLAPDEQIRASVMDDILANMPQSESVRAARQLIQTEAELERLNPFGLSVEARRAHNAALRAVLADAGREAGTLTSRPLPQPVTEGLRFAPVDLRAIESVGEIGPTPRERADQINLERQVEILRNDVARLTEQREALSGRSTSEVIELEVPGRAQRIEELEAQAERSRMRGQQPTDAVVRELEALRNDTATTTALRNRDRDIDAINRSLRRQEKRLAAAQEMLDRRPRSAPKPPKMKFSPEAAEAIAGLMRKSGKAAYSTPGGFVRPLRPRGAELTASEAPVKARENIRAVETTSQDREKFLEGAFDRALASVDEEMGNLDLGLPENVNLDQTIDLGDGQVVTVRAMLEDYQDDKNLLAAMTECAI